MMAAFTVGLVIENANPLAVTPETLVTVPPPPVTASRSMLFPDGVMVMVLPVEVRFKAPESPCSDTTPPPVPPPVPAARELDLCTIRHLPLETCGLLPDTLRLTL